MPRFKKFSGVFTVIPQGVSPKIEILLGISSWFRGDPFEILTGFLSEFLPICSFWNSSTEFLRFYFQKFLKFLKKKSSGVPPGALPGVRPEFSSGIPPKVFLRFQFQFILEFLQIFFSVDSARAVFGIHRLLLSSIISRIVFRTLQKFFLGILQKLFVKIILMFRISALLEFLLFLGLLQVFCLVIFQGFLLKGLYILRCVKLRKIRKSLNFC